MAYQFSEASEKRFQKTINYVSDKRSVIPPALYLLQRDRGYVDTEGMEYIALRLANPIAVSYVYGVATFIPCIKKPVGKYHVQVCANIFVLVIQTKSQSVLSKLGINKGRKLQKIKSLQ